MDCPRNSPGQNTGVGSLSLLQGIFPTQGLNSGLLHCRQILYQLSHKGNPRTLEWVAFSRGSSWPRNQTRVSCIAGRFFFLPTELSGKPYWVQLKSQSHHYRLEQITKSLNESTTQVPIEIIRAVSPQYCFVHVCKMSAYAASHIIRLNQKLYYFIDYYFYHEIIAYSKKILDDSNRN